MKSIVIWFGRKCGIVRIGQQKYVLHGKKKHKKIIANN